MVRSRLKSLLGRSRVLLMLYLIATDCIYGLKAFVGNFRSSSGSRHAGIGDVAKSLAYIDGVFDDYLSYAAISPADLVGKTVLEVGPGDNFGVALRFLTAGAARVACLDKFFSVRDDQQQAAIYAAMRGRLSDAEKPLFDRAMQAGSTHLRYVCGHGVEEAAVVLADEKFDYIVSRAVMEHVRDPQAAFTAMDALVKPGGKLIHKVDLRDHGMFSGHGLHPLTFLTIPDFVYGAMVKFSGRPNRALLPDYQDLLGRMNYRCRFFVTHVLGGEGDLLPHPDLDQAANVVSTASRQILAEIQPRLLPRFRDRDGFSLMVTGVFLIAEKSAASASFPGSVAAA